MKNSRTCELCSVNVHRASFVKHLRSKKLLEKEKQNEMNIPELLIKEEQTPIKNKIKTIYNPKALQQLASEESTLDDKELAKHTINPYYFTDNNLKLV